MPIIIIIMSTHTIYDMYNTLLTKSELFNFNFRKFYLSPAKNVEMGSRH